MRAAIDSGVAKRPVKDWEAYKAYLINRMGLDHKLMKNVTIRAKQDPQRVLFAEADHYKILKAAQQARDEGVCTPVFLGDRDKILALIRENNLDLENAEIIDPRSQSEDKRRSYFGDLFLKIVEERGLPYLKPENYARTEPFWGYDASNR